MGFLGCVLIDIVFILLTVLVIIYSVKKGFSGTTWGIISAVLSIGGAFALGWVIYTFVFGLFGWSDGIENTVNGWFGGPSTLLNIFTDMGVDYDMVVRIFAMVICILLMYIPCYFLVRFVLKSIGKLWNLIRTKLPLFKIVDVIIGVIANIALYAGVILIMFTVIYNLNGDFFVNARELLRSTYITRFVFLKNPLNILFAF